MMSMMFEDVQMDQQTARITKVWKYLQLLNICDWNITIE